MTAKKEKKIKGIMTVLQVVNYKDGHILIRKFFRDLFLWDVFYKGEFFSSYLIIKPVKGKLNLEDKEISEIIKMCYAGAATTIDYQMGEKMSKTEEEVVKQFEQGRKLFEGDA